GAVPFSPTRLRSDGRPAGQLVRGRGRRGRATIHRQPPVAPPAGGPPHLRQFLFQRDQQEQPAVPASRTVGFVEDRHPLIDLREQPLGHPTRHDRPTLPLLRHVLAPLGEVYTP